MHTKKAHLPEKLDFIGIGTPRSATTWISDCLRDHPEIYIPNEKELEYFGDIEKFFVQKTIVNYLRGEKWFAGKFENNPDTGILGEFTPWYIYSKSSAKMIRAHNPNIKIVLSLRNPIDRLHSFYLHVNNRYPLPNIGETIRTYPEFVAQGYYMKFIKQYLKLFPRNQMHIILFDDIKKTPGKVIDRVYNFLNVATDFVPTFLERRINSVGHKYRPEHRAVQKFMLRRNKSAIAQKIFDGTKAVGLDVPVRKLLNKTSKIETSYKPLDTEIREYLHNTYEPHNQRLSQFLERDLSAWK